MSNVLCFVKMDVLGFKPYRKFLFMLLLAFLTFFEPLALSAQLVMFLAVTGISPYLFASQEKNDMHRLYSLLPISRQEIVLGRYVACIAGTLLYVLAMTVILSFFPTFTGLSTRHLIYSMIVCVGIILLAVAVQFPIFFKVGFIKGAIWRVAPTFVLIGVLFAFRKIAGIDFLTEVSVLSAVNSLGVLAVGIIAIIISICVSVRIYKTQEK